MTVNGEQVPGPLLQSAVDYVNDSLQQMANLIQANGEANSTAIILTAKHGQSPQNNNQLQKIDDGPIIAGVNAAWAAQHPNNPTLVVEEADDDGLLWWLSDRSQAAADFVNNYLWTHTAPAVDFAGQTITVQHSGLAQIFAGQQFAQFFGVSSTDPHHPDVFGISQVGTIYTTGSKIAEHGGDNPADRDVPLVVYAPGAVSLASQPMAGKRPRSLRPSCSCWGFLRTRCRPSKRGNAGPTRHRRWEVDRAFSPCCRGGSQTAPRRCSLRAPEWFGWPLNSMAAERRESSARGAD